MALDLRQNLVSAQYLVNKLTEFHQIFIYFKNKLQNGMVSKKKESIVCVKMGLKIHPSGSSFVISWQALWCQMVILGADFSIHPSQT